MGEFRAVRRHWAFSNDDTLMRAYMAMDGPVSVADIVARLAEVAPGVDMSEVMLNSATASWLVPATEDERAERQRQRRASDEHNERWERDAYERLRVKYEGTGQS